MKYSSTIWKRPRKTNRTIGEELEKQNVELREARKLYKTQEDIKNRLSQKLELEQSIVSLEQYRDQLKPGEACPVCGSEDHPLVDSYAENHTR